MVFSSGIFLFLFLPITLLLYHLAKRIETKNIVLLITSIIFYAWGEPIYVLLLLGSIVLNWKFGLLVSDDNKNKHVWLVVSAVFNLAILFLFKYLGFVCDNLNLILHSKLKANIILPIGISFFTFQAMSYVIDVYRGKGIAQKQIRNVALYISLFPQLIAGPIVRYETVANQISNRFVDSDKFSDGVRRFILGLGKKVVFANNFSLIADTIFDSTTQQGAALHWIGAIAYSLQILFDFSGYSDMAIGLGKMFGFEFLENFNYPYISKSITEFWRRWHISLGTWFRDYVYIPLGGNRVTKTRHIFNLFIVWLLTGIWHGANWTFIAWGLFYFVLLVIEKYTHLDKMLEKRFRIFSHIYTLFFVMLGWIIFRSVNISAALLYIKGMFGPAIIGEDLTLLKEFLGEYIVVFVLSFGLLVPWSKCLRLDNYKSARTIKDALLLLILLLSVAYIMKGSYSPFIYFNF